MQNRSPFRKLVMNEGRFTCLERVERLNGKVRKVVVD